MNTKKDREIKAKSIDVNLFSADMYGDRELFEWVRVHYPYWQTIPIRFDSLYDDSGQTTYQPSPLFTAAQSKDFDKFQLLLQGEEDMDQKDPLGEPLLCHAADVPTRYGNANILMVTLLLDRGANPNIQDDYGNTPLHKAISAYEFPQSSKIVALLLERGADPKIKNDAGQTPFELPGASENQEIAEITKKYHDIK